MTIVADSSPPAPGVKLQRSLGALGVILLTLSWLSPAASVMIAGSDIFHQAGTGAIWAFLIGAVVMAAVTTTQAELGASFPLAGGDYATIARSLGPFGGFLAFALAVLLLPAFIALFSLGVAIYLRPAFANLSSVWVTLITLGLAVAISILNVRTNALITGAFLAIEVGALLLLAALGFLHPARSLGDLLTHPIRLDSAGTLVAVSGGIVALATASAAWTLSGANLAIPLSEEMKAPRTVGLLVMLIFTISTLLIMTPVVGTLVGARDLRTIMYAESPFLAFLSEGTSPLIATVVGIAIAAAIFNATIAGVVGASRMVYSSGRDGVWDGWTNRALASLHPRFNSPWIAALVVGATSMAVSLLSVHTLLILNASTFAAIYALLGLALYRGRRLGLTGKVGYRAPFFPLTPIMAIVTSIGLAVAQYFDMDSGRPGLLVTATLLLLASSYYYWILSRRPGGWRLMGPAGLDE